MTRNRRRRRCRDRMGMSLPEISTPRPVAMRPDRRLCYFPSPARMTKSTTRHRVEAISLELSGSLHWRSGRRAVHAAARAHPAPELADAYRTVGDCRMELPEKEETCRSRIEADGRPTPVATSGAAPADVLSDGRAIGPGGRRREANLAARAAGVRASKLPRCAASTC